MNNYVDSLMQYASDMSNTLAQETSYIIEKNSSIDQNNAEINISNLDGGTYYINGEMCIRDRVGGVDVREYNLEALRDQVSMVLQKNVLFSGSIYENIRWGDEHASDEEVQRVCRLAQADGFVNEFPDGYNTMIVQGGNNVSGGQKQRLCIARALLKKPKILILDDSTSAVDTRTDALIRKAFREEIPDTTKPVSYTHLLLHSLQAHRNG